jgi:hypothetical protein
LICVPENGLNLYLVIYRIAVNSSKYFQWKCKGDRYINPCMNGYINLVFLAVIELKLETAHLPGYHQNLSQLLPSFDIRQNSD